MLGQPSWSTLQGTIDSAGRYSAPASDVITARLDGQVATAQVDIEAKPIAQPGTGGTVGPDPGATPGGRLRLRGDLPLNK